ncbi:MAG: aminotransferase class V-fold PLP-dependent enzyme [Pseudomonadota bacterium]
MCVDGVHAFGVEQESVGELGCDFLVAGCHKWLFGPRGTGMVWGRADAWNGLAGIVPSVEWAGLVAWMQASHPPPVCRPDRWPARAASTRLNTAGR